MLKLSTYHITFRKKHYPKHEEFEAFLHTTQATIINYGGHQPNPHHLFSQDRLNRNIYLQPSYLHDSN